jgi:hypothetical protein
LFLSSPLVLLAFLQALTNHPVFFDELTDQPGKERIPGLPVAGADIVEPVIRDFPAARFCFHHFIQPALFLYEPFRCNMPSLAVYIPPQAGCVALGLQDQEGKGTDDVRRLLQQMFDKGAAHTAENGAVHFSGQDALQSVTLTAFNARCQPCPLYMGTGRAERTFGNIGCNGRGTPPAGTKGNGQIGMIGPDIGYAGPFRNESGRCLQAFREMYHWITLLLYYAHYLYFTTFIDIFLYQSAIKRRKNCLSSMTVCPMDVTKQECPLIIDV